MISTSLFSCTKIRKLFLMHALTAVAVLFPQLACASLPNHLFRVDIRPKRNFTRLAIQLENTAGYTVAQLPGNRIRLVIKNTDGPILKKIRRYSDSNIGGVVLSRRGNDLLATFQIAPGTGWRDISREGVSAITLDFGKTFNQPAAPPLAGREKIWNGIEKLVRDFDPPLKPEIPFLPTDSQILKNILPEDELLSFNAGEAALYKGRLSEAEEIFTLFAGKQTPIRSIALFRLGETYYKLQKYPQALNSFREAEKIWPAFLNFNPGVLFYYGDSVARGGDLRSARTMLAELIARLADKQFAPALLVRLGDILTRQGHAQEALGLYRTVADNFYSSKANRMALLRLNDLNFLKVTPWSYRDLSESYLDLYQQSGDLDLREEALFKHALLESLHGGTSEALRLITMFQKKFPRSIYATVGKNIREVLVTQTYLETEWSNEALALLRFTEEQQEYLSGCIAHPEFLPKVAAAYEEGGRPIEMIRLFASLLDRPWSAPGAAFMYESIAENANLLGDDAMAEKYARLFLKNYPAHPDSRLMLERLGGLYFSQDKYQETKDTLLWLLNKGERAKRTESYYYLGSALWELKQLPSTIKAFDLFFSSQPENLEHLLPDAYYQSAAAHESSGDRKGALRLLEAGIKSPAVQRKDALYYKSGQLAVLEGKKELARGFFDQVAKKSLDPDWQKLARQALESVDIAVARPNGRKK